MAKPDQGKDRLSQLLIRLNIKKSALQLVKFNIIGVLNAIITYSLFSLLAFLGLHYILALICEYAVGITISYIFNKKITFKNKQRTGFKLISKMIVSYMLSFIFSMLLLMLFIEIAGLNKYLARLFAAAIVGGFSFLMQKFFVFAEKKQA